jgi:hypothetical protein
VRDYAFLELQAAKIGGTLEKFNFLFETDANKIAETPTQEEK